MAPRPRLRVCLISQQIDAIISGIGLYTRNVVDRLAADGHRVWLIGPGSCPWRPAEAEFLPVTPTRLRSHARWLPLAWRFRIALRELLVRETLDIVHFTDARESLWSHWGHACAIGNVNDYYATVATWRPNTYWRYYADWLTRWPYWNLVRILESRALRRLDAAVCNSHYTARMVQERYDLTESQTPVCYKSVAVPLMPPLVRRRAPNTPPLVLFAGGNMQRKGLPCLIRAAPALMARFPNIEFMVVGWDPNEAALRRLCERHGVVDRFRFVGNLPYQALQAAYREADVFAMPSLMEAFGVVFLEAMAAGTPVVAGDVGGTRELIQHEVNGLLVQPGDPAALAQAVIRLIEDEELRNQVIQTGWETVQRFSLPRMMERVYEIYDAVLARVL